MHVLDITQMLRGCRNGISGAKWQTLPEDSTLNGIDYAAGSQYKTFVTRNFGWVVASKHEYVKHVRDGQMKKR